MIPFIFVFTRLFLCRRFRLTDFQVGNQPNIILVIGLQDVYSIRDKHLEFLPAMGYLSLNERMSGSCDSQRTPMLVRNRVSCAEGIDDNHSLVLVHSINSVHIATTFQVSERQIIVQSRYLAHAS